MSSFWVKRSFRKSAGHILQHHENTQGIRMSNALKTAKATVAFCAVLCLLLPLPAAAELAVEKKLDNGDDTLRYVWVILAEGYTETQQEKFSSDTERLISDFFSVSPWKDYQKAINVYTIFAPSDDPGADHPSEGIYADTAFDATYDTYGISRLLTVNESKALQAAAQVPQFDVVIALVNDTRYGGSGGTVIAASLHEASNEILLHEAGHLVGHLADEYTTPYPGFPAGDSEPNVTYETDPGKIKWQHWIDPETPLPTPESDIESVGLFEGARYLSEGIFRPKYTCRMKSLNQPYCPICREAIILSIYSYVDLIEAFSPEAAAVDLTPGAATTFAAGTLETDDAAPYAVAWSIDGNILEDERQAFLYLAPSMLTRGDHSVSVAVHDETAMVRTDQHGLLHSQHTWTVTKNFCSGRLSGTITDAATGRPVADASIALEGREEELHSSSQGGFAVSDISCGVYSIRTEAAGYAQQTLETAITDGREKTVHLELKPAGGLVYLWGIIRGDVQPGLVVQLEGTKTCSAATDNNGKFILGPVEPGDYTIRPSASGYRFFPPLLKVRVKDKETPQIAFSARKKAAAFAPQDK